MTTDSCGRCGSPAPEALLRQIELHVDGSSVDEQTVCPDCFADWIAHYQAQMAGDMAGAADGGSAKSPSDSALNAAVAAAKEQGSPQGTTTDGLGDTAGSADSGGDEIREVGGGPSADDGEVEVDLGSESDVADDDEDDDGLLLG